MNSLVGRQSKTLYLSGKALILYYKIERNLSIKNSQQHSILVQRGKTRRNTDETVAKMNPKVDSRLLAEYERLVAALGSGIRSRKQGQTIICRIYSDAMTCLQIPARLENG